MRIAVMGTGGLGGAIGGLLARAGEDVSFIARGPHLDAMKTRGLTIKSSLAGDFTIRAPATNDPAEIGPVDLIVFGVKLYDLERAAEQVRPMVGPSTVILPIQNGIDATERIGSIVGSDAVIGGTATVGGRIEEPGVITHTALANTITCGELPNGISSRTERVREVLERAGFVALTHPDIKVPIWEKFVPLVSTGGVMAATRLTAGQIRSCPETRALLTGMMEEIAAVGRAHGVAIGPDLIERQVAFLDQVPPMARTSLAADLLNGRRLELESLNGAVVRLGQQAGIPTPLNFAIYAALKPYVDGAPT